MSYKIKVQGFVLKKKNLMNDDVQVVIFTKELGKLFLIAKGARKLKSRRAPHIQTGNLITAVLTQNKDFYYLQQSDLISAFSQIRDPISMGFLYQFLFAVEGLMPQEQIDTAIFDLLKKFILELHNKGESQKVVEKYLSDLIFILGYVSEEDQEKDIFKKIEEILGRALPKHAIINSYEN